MFVQTFVTEPPVDALDVGVLHRFAGSDERQRDADLLRRCASDSVIPPNLAFQLQQVASEIPYLRHNSAGLRPASRSFNTLMICSSLNRSLPFPLSWNGLYTVCRLFTGSRSPPREAGAEVLSFTMLTINS